MNLSVSESRYSCRSQNNTEIRILESWEYLLSVGPKERPSITTGVKKIVKSKINNSQNRKKRYVLYIPPYVAYLLE